MGSRGRRASDGNDGNDASDGAGSSDGSGSSDGARGEGPPSAPGRPRSGRADRRRTARRVRSRRWRGPLMELPLLALGALLLCLAVAAGLWLAVVRGNTQKSLSQKISDDYTLMSAPLEEGQSVSQTFSYEEDLLAVAVVFGTSGEQPAGTLNVTLTDADTGEVRVPRMLGVFSAGRIVNPRLARSQLIGGMTMGLSMALHEHSVLDPQFGHVINHDFAQYHIAAHADVADIEAIWLDEQDPHSNPMGSRGVGEIGIVGSPAAIANASAGS